MSLWVLMFCQWTEEEMIQIENEDQKADEEKGKNRTAHLKKASWEKYKMDNHQKG